MPSLKGNHHRLFEGERQDLLGIDSIVSGACPEETADGEATEKEENSFRFPQATPFLK
jgi:hypothetical protein